MLSLLSSALLLLLVYRADAYPFADLNARAGVCQSGIYGELSPVLQSYSVAVQFCQAIYPVKCSSAKAKIRKRVAPSTVTTTV